ncbi:E3 ubiquitin-protein ligase TRIM33-like [Acanthaster planci]|uniref:E3 ubiquitin-protein ligase TRIM33-like n=1 Tax=Acanthaster planci TaxID=133434 RepID=A0A8B7XLL5_ACAPL|nr:E3 ubiquitin-protein ligase TRIM33-like [Acanthaster planci]
MAATVTAESVWEKIIQRRLECSICRARYQEPKMLNCTHSFCLRCLQDINQTHGPNTNKLTCPLCQRETIIPEGGITDLISNYDLVALLADVTKQEQFLQRDATKVMCQGCDEGNEAISHCMDCGHYLCQECKKAHQRLAALRTHKLTSLAELSDETMTKPVSTKGYVSKCDSHPGQELCFYCNPCEQLICKVCSTSSHREPAHSFVNFKTATDICLNRARELTFHVFKFNSAKAATQIPTNWESSRKRLSMMLAQTKRQICQKAEMEVAKIRQKERQLLQQAQLVFGRRDKTLAELVLAEHTMKMVHTNMTEASQLDILKLREKLLHSHKDVITEPTDDLTPELSFISFAENQTEVDIGNMLLKEKWTVMSSSNITGELIASLSTNDTVVVNKGQQKLTKLSPDGKILHVCPISQLQGEDPGAVRRPVDFEVNKDDQLIILFESAVKIFNKEYQLLHQFSPSKEADTDGTPSCLAVDGNNLIAVGYKDKERISLHNPDGSFIRTLPSPAIGSYMTISTQRIIYTNTYTKQLISVDYEGNEKFREQIYQGQVPRGVCCDEAGDIYIITESYCLYHYSSEGKYIETLVRDLRDHNDIKFTSKGQLAMTGPSSTRIYHRI